MEIVRVGAMNNPQPKDCPIKTALELGRASRVVHLVASLLTYTANGVTLYYNLITTEAHPQALILCCVSKANSRHL